MRSRPADPELRGLILLAAFLVLGAFLPLLDGTGLDGGITQAFQSRASRGLDHFLSSLTPFGSAEVTGIFVLLVAGTTWRRRGLRPALWLLLPFLASAPLELLGKFILPHPGPGPAFQRGGIPWLGIHVLSPGSFPSGHVLRSTYVAGLLLAWYAGRPAKRDPRWRWAIFASLGLMGISRIYLGDHWASDVLGGYLLGGALASIGVSGWRATPVREVLRDRSLQRLPWGWRFRTRSRR